jgi:flagellar basal-body rod protein FlgF
MENTSYVALSRQTALWRQLEITANNMSNVNTPAFKAEEVQFEDYNIKTKSDMSPFGRVISFVHDYATIRDTTEGPLRKTEAPLDVAIHGDGYFTLDTPSGKRYTREGNFRLDENGMIVTPSGYPILQTNDNPIVLAPNETQISIASDGTISTENGIIGKIKIVKFDNDQLVRKVGDGSYETTQPPNDIQVPYLSQGMLEESNVQPILQMTTMMSLLRNYEGVQNIIDGEHQKVMKSFSVLSQSQVQA